MSDRDMHESITEHVALERGKNQIHEISHKSGYDIGFEDGRKRAWDLAGEAADWYKSQIKQRGQTTSAPDDMNMQARYEAALWIQQAIKRDSV